MTNRLSHAMFNLVFQNDNDAGIVALGNGSIEQKMMHNKTVSLQDLKVTDRYITDIARPQGEYEYTCTGGWSHWNLENYCDDDNRNGIIDTLE